MKVETNREIALTLVGEYHLCEKYCGLVEDVEAALDEAERRGMQRAVEIWSNDGCCPGGLRNLNRLKREIEE